MTFPDSLDDKLSVDGLNLRTTEDYTIEGVNGAIINLKGDVRINDQAFDPETGAVTPVVHLTQSEYDAILPAEDVFYVITDAAGRTILSGAAAPTALIGEDGDFYLRLNAARDLYGPKTAGAWGSPVQLQGPIGPTGIVATVVAGTGITVDSTNPANPIVAASSAGAIPYSSPSTAAVGGTRPYVSFPDACKEFVSSNLTLTDGVLFAIPMQLNFSIQLEALYVEVSTLAASSVIRLGFVPANKDWTPVTTGVISLATLDSSSIGGKQLTGLSTALAAGRWLRLIRAEGGSPVVNARRLIANGAHLSQIAWEMVWTTNMPLRKNASGSGAFSNPVPALNDGYSATGTFGSGGTMNGYLDPVWATFISP